jgi:hypothetical protein
MMDSPTPIELGALWDYKNGEIKKGSGRDQKEKTVSRCHHARHFHGGYYWRGSVVRSDCGGRQTAEHSGCDHSSGTLTEIASAGI